MRIVFITAMSKRLFEGAQHAEAYARFRPHYGADVFNRIIEFCREKAAATDLAVDVGCGSGQSTTPLAKYFKRVIGVDVSESQIKTSPKDIPNVEFRVGKAEALGFLSENSVDLVTIAQALHWTDQPAFFAEVTRILRPGGALVAYGYNNNKFDNQAVQEVVDKLYYETLDGYWDSHRRFVEEGYQSFSLPFPAWRRDDSMAIRKWMTVDDFVGFLSTWSSWQAYLKAYPQSRELENVRARLKAILSSGLDGDRDSKFLVSWPVFMLMGHKPS